MSAYVFIPSIIISHLPYAIIIFLSATLSYHTPLVIIRYRPHPSPRPNHLILFSSFSIIVILAQTTMSLHLLEKDLSTLSVILNLIHPIIFLFSFFCLASTLK